MFFSGANWVVVVLLVFHLLLFYFILLYKYIWFGLSSHVTFWYDYFIFWVSTTKHVSTIFIHIYLSFFAFFATFLLFCLLLLFFAIFVRLSVWDSDSELKTEKGFSTSLSKCTFVILVRVECTPSDMLVSLSLANDFRGRIYATGTVYILGQ